MRIFPWPGNRRGQPAVIAVGALGVVGLIAVNRPGPAVASGPTTTFTDAQTKMCPDSSPASPGTGAVGTDQCDGTASQEWSIAAAGDPNVTVR